ncbi:MAG TPA: hypothetical protein VMT67_02445 [Terriglobales bacterium]|nr:hypothetical protein [Terriglobales bacterium]
MNRLTGYLLSSSLLFGCLCPIAAQENSGGMHNPPKVLNILREFTKPGKNGMSHEKTESAFIKAMTAAKSPEHYLAVDSMSGKPRSLFLTGFDSFEAMEKAQAAVEKNPAFMEALDHAGVVDGELLSDTDSGDFAFREDLSLRPAVDIAHMRYFEISLFHVKPGHDKDFEALAKLYQQGFERIQSSHWAVYEAVYGQTDGTFVVFEPMKSLAEVDKGFAEYKDFESALGEDGVKKLNELYSVAIESSQSNLFEFNPRMSYVGEDWIKANPDFWKPKAAAASKKEVAKKKE